MAKKENKLDMADIGWAETAPSWLEEELKHERLIHGLASITNHTDKMGDAEAMFYLYSLSLRAPMPHTLTNAYLYLGAKLMKRRGVNPLPDFLRKRLEQGLSADEQRELDDLKRELYRKRRGGLAARCWML